MVTGYIAVFLLPPLAPMLIALAGHVLARSKPRRGRILIVLGWGSLALFSTQLVGSALMSALEPHADDPLAYVADAVVVLGAGTYVNSPEYGGDTVNGKTLERLRYAAHLQRRTGKPLLVTGGSPLGTATSEAEQMRNVLQNEWHIPVAWTEQASANTLGNARYSAAILAQAGILRIYLVTHAWHMPRARLAFESTGLTVVPAPLNYTTRLGFGLGDLLPTVDGMIQSSTFGREVLGVIWYRFLLFASGVRSS